MLILATLLALVFLFRNFLYIGGRKSHDPGTPQKNLVHVDVQVACFLFLVICTLFVFPLHFLVCLELIFFYLKFFKEFVIMRKYFIRCTFFNFFFGGVIYYLDNIFGWEISFIYAKRLGWYICFPWFIQFINCFSDVTAVYFIIFIWLTLFYV